MDASDTNMLETLYFCSGCNVHFREDRLPNINRLHHCGKVAQIVSTEGQGEGTNEG